MKPAVMNEGWWKFLKHKFEDGTLDNIRKQLTMVKFSPENPQHIFRAFDLDPNKVRVVMVGLSPYYDHHAQGYCFATHAHSAYVEYPYSLKVIADAIADVENIDKGDIDRYLCSDLVMWQIQGCMLLNVALTTIPGKSDSHIELWKPFMSEVFKVLNELDSSIIFYFFGNTAFEYSKYLTNHHHIYKSVHPAALYHNPGMVFDSKFGEVKEKYQELYGRTLDWVLPF